MNFDARIGGSAASPGDLEGNPLLNGSDADSRNKRWLIIGAVLLFALLAGIWFLSHKGASEVSTDPKTQIPVVSVITPGSGTVSGQINATGNLAARRELPVGVAGEGGQVVQVLVEPGQWVRQGQVLAVIDRSVQVQQQASQAAQVQVSRANAELAQANYDRAVKLVDKGFISKADIDRLRSTRDAAYAQVRVSGAQLGVLKAQSHRLNILAPAAGLVLERKTEPGQVVSSGSGVLFRLAKGGEMEMLAQVGEVDLGKLALGGSADVTPVGSDRAFIGQIWQLSPVVDPQTRMGIARIALTYAPELRPGGFASAVIKGGTVVAPVLPESAILSDEKGSFVYVVTADNKAVRRPVKTGLVIEHGIAVIEGLNGTERVVLRAGGFLNSGDRIKPQLVKAN
ncbi:MAG: efflux RND transporter periplasmic adaptor subunit [Proteobacteria bacterium]|nr:efflux RND transporter periplasmic adaptor subunit [Pseudomonadota bacterium]